MTIWTVEDFYAHQHNKHHHHHRHDDNEISLLRMAQNQMIAADKHTLEADESWLAYTTRLSATSEVE